MKADLLIDILQWDTQNWSVPLEYWETILAQKPIGLKCLELGGREGGLSLWMALKGHDVICSDFRDSALTAKPLHDKYRLKNVVYEDIDATNIPYENFFDVIVFKSILGGIGRNDNRMIQEKVISEIHKALKPRGVLLFAENAPATRVHKAFRRKFTNWGNAWRYVSNSDMLDFLSAFSSYEIKTAGFIGTFGRSESQKRLLGKIDGALNFLPSSWKYIIYGSAVK